MALEAFWTLQPVVTKVLIGRLCRKANPKLYRTVLLDLYVDAPQWAQVRTNKTYWNAFRPLLPGAIH